MNAYAEYEFIFILKSNTVAAAKERELAWQKIADRVNVWVLIEKKDMFYPLIQHLYSLCVSVCVSDCV